MKAVTPARAGEGGLEARRRGKVGASAVKRAKEAKEIAAVIAAAR